MNSDLALAKTLQTALENGLRLTRDVVEVGEANAYFHPTEPLEFFSYAVPSQEMSAKGLHDVVDAFRRRARIPRFELIRELYPQTVELAARLGWSTEIEAPIMTLTLSDLQHMDSSKVVLASNEAQRRDAWIVSMEAFGMESSDEPTTFSMDSTAIAYDGAQPAASGWMVGGGPIAELCGVGTRQEFRRRGYASAVSHRLLDAFFEGGGELAWLSAGDDAAEEVYSRLGFKRALTQVNLRWTD